MSGGKLEFRLFVSFYVPLTSIDHPMTQPDLFVMLNWFTNTIITGVHVIVSHYHITALLEENKLIPKPIFKIRNNKFKYFSDGKK